MSCTAAAAAAAAAAAPRRPTRRACSPPRSLMLHSPRHYHLVRAPSEPFPEILWRHSPPPPRLPAHPSAHARWAVRCKARTHRSHPTRTPTRNPHPNAHLRARPHPAAAPAGIEYTTGGEPQGINNIGEWSLDKRHYGGDHPPKHLQPPPAKANAAAFWLLEAWNEASAGTPGWPDSKSMGTIGWRREAVTGADMAGESASARVARRVVDTRWAWGGVDGFVFGAGGKLVTPWGKGKWGLVARAGGGADGSGADDIGDGGEAGLGAQVARCADCLFADFANANHNLRFSLEGDTPHTFRSVRVGDYAVVHGRQLEGSGDAADRE